METKLLSLTPYENFLFGMKATETKRQYPHRFDKFLTYMGLQGTIEEKCTRLYELANENVSLIQAHILFVLLIPKENAYKERRSRREQFAIMLRQ